MDDGCIIMDTGIKAKWCTALRGGEYKQGKGSLRTRNDDYCCLGLLSDIHAKDSPDVHWEENTHGAWVFGKDRVQGVLSEETSEWAGLGIYDDPMLTISQEQEDLYAPSDYACTDHHFAASMLNDWGVPFNVIADLIEDQL